MYNLNELAFEAMLENLKHINNGNPFMELVVDNISYEYNRAQYNDCIRHINDENNQITNIYNQISQRGGFITPQEQKELQRHVLLRSEYEMKSMKHEIKVTMFASANTPPLGDNMQIRRDYTAKHSRIVGCSACGGKVFLADVPF